ncbi:helix-turn-helix DNA-binding domain protein [Mycobacterium phage GaugeLDP]|nr:helix-turn-helix DNA-binding domain protein [Mycobacterium phage GaugeLDP]
MIRKKHLKAALADERALNESLERENASLTQLYYETKEDLKVAEQEHLRVIDIAKELEAANTKLAGRLNEALAANRRFAIQQRTQNELFGRALAQVQPDTGPSRPNRKKLTEAEVRDIRDAYFGGAKQKDLAEKFGVNPATISRTVRGVYH